MIIPITLKSLLLFLCFFVLGHAQLGRQRSVNRSGERFLRPQDCGKCGGHRSKCPFCVQAAWRSLMVFDTSFARDSRVFFFPDQRFLDPSTDVEIYVCFSK